MKYLSQYMEERQSEAFKKARAFFAFSQDQLQKGKEENNIKQGEKLLNLGMGMICPAESADVLMDELDTIYKESIQQDIQENGMNAIVRRELNNHEAYYTGDIESTVQALADYPVTAEDIRAVFKNKNHELVPTV